MQDKDNLDYLLDSALATYADPGPDPGLEQRVLCALAAERSVISAPKRRWLPWAIALPLAASLLLWLSIGKLGHAPSVQNNQAHQATPAASHLSSTLPQAGDLKGHDISRAGNPSASHRTSASEGGPFRTSRPMKRSQLPKLYVFPSPQPLTEEEKILVSAATHGSDAQHAALLAAAKPRSDVPLAIAALDIPPLAAPGEGQP